MADGSVRVFETREALAVGVAAAGIATRGENSQLCSACAGCETCKALPSFDLRGSCSSAGTLTPTTSRPHTSPSSPAEGTLSRISSSDLGYALANTVSSAWSMLPRANSPAEKDAVKKMNFHMRHLAENKRVVDSKVFSRDLTATWGDQQIHGKDVDWKQCLVSDRTWDEMDEQERMECQKLARRKADEKAAEAGIRTILGEIVEGAATAAEGSCSRSYSKLLMEDPGASPRRTVSAGDTPLPIARDAYHTRRSGFEPPTTQVSSSALLSSGANGKVLRAVWKGSINVAIKEALPGKENEEETQLFIDLHHPHLVACFGILEMREIHDPSKVTSRIVTECCTTNLKAFLKNHDNWLWFHEEPRTPDSIDFCKYTILEHVSQGLEKLHDMGVLHRDLKCLNILLDGESGECDTCHHSGKWKICDFGESEILRTPTLAFDEAVPFTAPLDPKRLEAITAQSLLDAGAIWYCWLHPGETIETAAGEEAKPYSGTEALARLREELSGLDWEALKTRAKTEFGFVVTSDHGFAHVIEGVIEILNPFPRGALVYSFSEDRSVRDKRDCVFAVREQLNEVPEPLPFPAHLRAFNLIPCEELQIRDPEGPSIMRDHVHLDIDGNSYSISQQARHRSLWHKQVDCLHTLYPGGIHGRISKPHPVRTSPLGRIRRRIPQRERSDPNLAPLQATHFVFAYQLEQWTTDSTFSTQQLEVFKMYSGEISLASYGGFIYLHAQVDEHGQVIARTAQVVGINSLSMGPAPVYPGGAINMSTFDDRYTPMVASPEMWSKSNIGLETDIYAFGCVM